MIGEAKGQVFEIIEVKLTPSRRKAIRKKMLKMQSAPTICLKTHSEMTKYHANNPHSLHENARILKKTTASWRQLKLPRDLPAGLQKYSHASILQLFGEFREARNDARCRRMCSTRVRGKELMI